MCSDAYVAWMEMHYTGIYRGKDHYNDWLFYAAKDRFPRDVPRQQALRFMLISAINPISIPRDWRAQLKQHGWRSSQVRACLLCVLRGALADSFSAAEPLTAWPERACYARR